MALEQNVQSIELVIKVVSLVDIKTQKKTSPPRSVASGPGLATPSADTE